MKQLKQKLKTDEVIAWKQKWSCKQILKPIWLKQSKKRGLTDMVCKNKSIYYKHCLPILDLSWARSIFSLLASSYPLATSLFKFSKRFWSDKLKSAMLLFRASIISLSVWIFFTFNIKRSWAMTKWNYIQL